MPTAAVAYYKYTARTPEKLLAADDFFREMGLVRISSTRVSRSQASQAAGEIYRCLIEIEQAGHRASAAAAPPSAISPPTAIAPPHARKSRKKGQALGT